MYSMKHRIRVLCRYSRFAAQLPYNSFLLPLILLHTDFAVVYIHVLQQMFQPQGKTSSCYHHIPGLQGQCPFHFMMNLKVFQ